jgi:hypothetical protein
MAWTVPERAEFAALKRHALCRALGGGDVTKGLHRLLLAERRVEQYLDREHRNEPSAPRPVHGNAAASPTRSAAATGAGMTKETAQRRRRPASAARKARSSARLQEFLAAKEGERHHLRSVLQRWRRQHTELAEEHGKCEPLLALQGKGAKRTCAEVSPSEPSGDSRSYAASVRNGCSPPPSATIRGLLPPAPDSGGDTPPLPSASALAKRQMLSPPPARPLEPEMEAVLPPMASQPQFGIPHPPGLIPARPVRAAGMGAWPARPPLQA